MNNSINDRSYRLKTYIHVYAKIQKISSNTYSYYM